MTVTMKISAVLSQVELTAEGTAEAMRFSVIRTCTRGSGSPCLRDNGEHHGQKNGFDACTSAKEAIPQEIWRSEVNTPTRSSLVHAVRSFSRC